jgi:iron complex transport system ATP-binding protein
MTGTPLGMLSARDVSFSYESRFEDERAFVLQDVSATIPRGSLTALLGPNGCGKTTLLKLLSGILRPRGGSLALNGHDLAAIPRRELARHVAVVPQETHPAFDYSAIEMVLMGRHPHLGPFRLEGPDDLTIAREAMAATSTDHLAHRPYATLSGGEKQRVVIAAALAQQPDVLLLDEPTASLDLGSQLEVAALLVHLNRTRDVTMVLATHDLNLAASVCDAVVMLRAGRVLAQGPTREVLTRPMIQQLYDVEADVRFHEDAGHLTIVPVRRVP